MKKTLLLGAIAAAGTFSFGCALTDYGQISAPLNKTHGVIGCDSDDRFANTQQTLEPATRELLYTATDDATGDTICPGFDPSVTTETVSREDARAWSRFNGPYHFNTETQVFGAGGGTWAMAGVKELNDGSSRITTYFSESTGSFSCVGAAVGGRYGGPEGVVVGDGYANPGAADARIPGWGPETVAIDDNPGAADFCSNIAAISSGRAAGGYSTYLGFLGRAAEGRVTFSPVTRRADSGLAQFFSGSQLTFDHAGIEFTAHAGILEDGRVELFIDALAKDGVTYEATNPVRLVVNPTNSFRTIEVHPTQDEVRDLYAFLIDAGLTDRALEVGGFIEELGVMVPDLQVFINQSFLENAINGSTGPIDG